MPYSQYFVGTVDSNPAVCFKMNEGGFKTVVFNGNFSLRNYYIRLSPVNDKIAGVESFILYLETYLQDLTKKQKQREDVKNSLTNKISSFGEDIDKFGMVFEG